MIDVTKVLIGIPAGLREPLIKTYREIATNFVEHRWGPSELNGGKFCEVVYTILDGCISGAFAAKPSKPQNMAIACRALEGKPASSARVGDDSLRVLIPRMLIPLYDVRNKRGVGHIGGDVDPNFMDATAVYGMASWIFAELIRIFHAVSTEEAQQIVNVLVERKSSLVWEIEGVRRVLDHTMPKKDQALILLYGSSSWVSDADLASWTEYSNKGMFKTRVLKPLHAEKFIEYDDKNCRVIISPKGVKEVEDRLLH